MIIFEKENFLISKTTKTNPPIDGLVFWKIKNTTLGEGYNLELNFVGKKRMRLINKRYRKIDRATDILSFPIDENNGEIFINKEESIKEAKKFEREIKNFYKFLFIHGLFHLQGMDHSDIMEKKEGEIRKIFKI